MRLSSFTRTRTQRNTRTLARDWAWVTHRRGAGGLCTRKVHNPTARSLFQRITILYEVDAAGRASAGSRAPASEAWQQQLERTVVAAALYENPDILTSYNACWQQIVDLTQTKHGSLDYTKRCAPETTLSLPLVVDTVVITT